MSKSAMKLTEYLPIAILTIAFCAALASVFAYDQRESAKREAYYAKQKEPGQIVFAGPYCFPDKHPNLLLYIALLTGVSFVIVVFTRLPAASLPSSYLALWLFTSWYLETRAMVNSDVSDVLDGFDTILYNATEFDPVVAFSLASVTAIQSAALARSVINQWFSCKLA